MTTKKLFKNKNFGKFFVFCVLFKKHLLPLQRIFARKIHSNIFILLGETSTIFLIELK